MKQRFWLIVASGALMLTLVMGLRQTFGFFLTPITEHLGTGREPYSFAMAIMNLLWGLGSPFAGALADRFGAGKIGAAGGLLYASGLWVMANSADTSQLVTAGVLIGFGLSGAGFTVVLGAVGRAAPAHKRTQALALATTGGSLGQFFAIPYIQALLGNFDWVFSLLIMTGTSLLMVPLALASWNNQATDIKTEQTLTQAFSEASRHRDFWLLTAGFFVCGFNLAFIGLHLPAYVQDFGFERSLAANGLMLIGLFNIIGTFGFGMLGGRFKKKSVLSGIYLARSLVFLGFLLTPISEASVLTFSAIMGLLWLGTVPLTSGVVATFFGPAYLSMLYGFVFFSHQLGSFSGAWLAGVMYDAFGSYELMWWLNVGLGVMAAAFHWPIKERPVARLATSGTD